MSEHNHQMSDDVLDRATAALRNAPVPEQPSLQLQASTVEALHNLPSRPETIRLHERRVRMFRIIRYSSAAAALLLIGIVGFFWLFDQSVSVSFAQVVENVNKAKTVSFTLKQKFGDQPEMEMKMSIRGDVLRHEIPEAMIMIVDTSRRKGLRLDPQRKVASKIDLEGRVPAEDLQDPIARLRDLKENIKDNVEELGDEELNGRKCHVYQVRGRVKAGPVLFGEQFKLWVDAKTGLPAKIQGGDDKTSLIYEQFRWNEPLQEDQFSLNVPRGYRLEELAPAVVRPGRLYYHKGWTELYSIQPDGQKPESQFVPRLADSPNTYVSERAELSPDGRSLAIAYTHSAKEGLFPPYRVLLWDRTRPNEPAVEVYARPDRELYSWRFSPDGQRLYVNWWQGIPTRKGPDGRYGADVVDLKTKEVQTLKLPLHQNGQGKETAMHFAAASADGRSYLVVGNGLHVATAEGKLVRRLSDANVIAASVQLSPDGEQAAYATFDAKDRSQQLYAVAVAGGEPKALTSAGKLTDIRARWSPDGKRIAYTCRLLDPAQPPFNHGTETYLRIIDVGDWNSATVLTEKVHPKGTGLQLTAWR